MGAGCWTRVSIWATHERGFGHSSSLRMRRGRYAEGEARYGPRDSVVRAVRAYRAVAEESRLSMTELALRFVLGRPYVSTAIVGASTPEQLRELVRACEAGPLDEETLERIDEVHREIPNPTP